MAQSVDPYFQRLEELLAAAKSKAALLEVIVNAPFHDPVQATKLDLGIVVFLLVNQKSQTIDRVALSDTEQAKGAVKMSEKPFKSIKIPVGHQENLIAQVIATGQPKSTADWKDLFIPDLSAQAARLNQAGAGIETSYVYPLKARHGGALIFSYLQPPKNLSTEHVQFMDTYTTLVDTHLL